jgi:hypothetical protein
MSYLGGRWGGAGKDVGRLLSLIRLLVASKGVWEKFH